MPKRLSALPDAPVSVLVFAGAALNELHEPLLETRLEGSRHPRGRTADHHARRDSDGQERDFRREVLGDEHVDAAIERTTDFTADFQNLITRYALGEIWSRPGLDRRTRSCITLTALVALGKLDELEMHVRAALRNGLTQDEIKEVLLQSAIYCGVPAANSAFAVAQRVLADHAQQPEAKGDAPEW